MQFSRRQFLRSAAVAPGLLTACRESESQPLSFAPPARPGRVVSARNAAAWQQGRLSGAAVGEMLDASLVALTGSADARKAWASTFKPGDRVAIKVNAIVRGATHLPLVLAVTERLCEAGVRPDRITIFDRTTRELRDAGFPVADSGERVRCRGTDDDFVGGWTILRSGVRLSRLLTDCDAVINMPVLKALSIGGLSFGMKNHYGSFDIPHRFHGSDFTPGVVALNGLDPIRTRTRLVIGDVLAEDIGADATDYAVIGGQATLLMASDPIALDRVGLQMAAEALRRAGGRDPRQAENWANRWLEEGEKVGLGVGTAERVRVERVQI